MNNCKLCNCSLNQIPAIYSLNTDLLFRENTPLLALFCTKNRLKSPEVTINEVSKICDLQPFSHFTTGY